LRHRTLIKEASVWQLCPSLLGFALGAAGGALAGALTDIGIDDDFIRQTRANVTPGTSALFVLSDHEVADRVIPELRELNPELVATNLPYAKEARLKELFAEAQPARP